MALRGGSLSRSLIAPARTFSSRPSISPIRRPTSPLQSYLPDSRRPFFTVTSIWGLWGCTESLLPLQSAIADTHHTSHISAESRAFCHLSQDANGSVKLSDFGLAKATKLNDIKSCRGTAFWMAPEVVKGKNQGYGLSADIWSLGCTVLEMLTGQIPYSHLECMQALFRIGKGERPLVPDYLSRDAQGFIMRCLQVNPDDRPTAAQLLNHQFVQRPLSTFSGSASPYIPARRG